MKICKNNSNKYDGTGNKGYCGWFEKNSSLGGYLFCNGKNKKCKRYKLFKKEIRKVIKVNANI